MIKKNERKQNYRKKEMNRKKEEEIYKKILKRKIELRITDKRQQTVTNTQITVERIRQEKKRKQMKDRKKAKGEREREINKYKGKKRRTEKELKKKKETCAPSPRVHNIHQVWTRRSVFHFQLFIYRYTYYSFALSYPKRAGRRCGTINKSKEEIRAKGHVQIVEIKAGMVV